MASAVAVKHLVSSSANSHAMVPRHLLEPAGELIELPFTGKRRALAHLLGPDTRHLAGLYRVEDRCSFRRELERVAVTAGDNDPEAIRAFRRGDYDRGRIERSKAGSKGGPLI
jgi:hypothetical protein